MDPGVGVQRPCCELLLEFGEGVWAGAEAVPALLQPDPRGGGRGVLSHTQLQSHLAARALRDSTGMK